MRDLGILYYYALGLRLLGLIIKKSFEHITIGTLPLLYKSYTLSYFRVWKLYVGPNFALDQRELKLERVQRRATRITDLILKELALL